MGLDLTFAKDIADLFLTLVLTVSTVLLAIYTWRLVDETREMRKEQVRPNMAIHLQHAETDPTLMFVVVENNGHGTAYNVHFSIEKDLNKYGAGDGSGQISLIGIFKYGMKYCPPGFNKKYFLLETVNDYKTKMDEELVFTVTYNDSFKKTTNETFHLSVKELSQWSTISPSDTHIGRIAGYLKTIDKNMEKLVTAKTSVKE